VKEVIGSEIFARLQSGLPPIREKIQGIQAVTIGINLDKNLHPDGAVLLSLDNEKHSGRDDGLLAKVFGRNNIAQALGPLHSPPLQEVHTGNYHWHKDPEIHGYAQAPQFIPLFRDLSDILGKTAKAVDRNLVAFNSINLEPWRQIFQELLELLFSAEYLQTWQKAGVPLTFPEILPEADNCLEVINMGRTGQQ